MLILPYLFLDGRCDEVLTFYQAVLRAEVVMLMRFKDAPDQSMIAPGAADKVMHASLEIGNSAVMVSDGRSSGKTIFGGTAMSLAVASDAEADQAFAALSDGGQISMKPAKTFFHPRSEWWSIGSACSGW